MSWSSAAYGDGSNAAVVAQLSTTLKVITKLVFRLVYAELRFLPRQRLDRSDAKRRWADFSRPTDKGSFLIDKETGIFLAIPFFTPGEQKVPFR
jgi:hypothetical protein